MEMQSPFNQPNPMQYEKPKVLQEIRVQFLDTKQVSVSGLSGDLDRDIMLLSNGIRAVTKMFVTEAMKGNARSESGLVLPQMGLVVPGNGVK